VQRQRAASAVEDLMPDFRLVDRILAAALAVTAAPLAIAPAAQAQQIQIAPPSGAPISFADLIERVRPAVVSISVRQRPSAARGQVFEGAPPGFEEFFRGPRGRNQPSPVALGSGFIIDAQGVIVTNHHVVAEAESITVRTSDGRDHEAELIGSDEPTDIAVLRLKEPGRFPFVSFARSANVRVGDWVVAVGNPFGLDGTATAGIVSAIGRRDFGSSAYVDFLQIDAPINRGNSGGPTFDLRGNVIGVNSAIFSPTGGNVGIGFAIPSQVASRIVDQIVQGGRVSRGWLGVQVQPLDRDIANSLGLEAAEGALVASVVPDGPAARAGLRTGDVILRFDGQSVADSRDLTQKVGAARIGGESRLDVLRNGERQNISVRLGERPSEQVLASNQPEDEPATANAETMAPLGATVRTVTDEDRSRRPGLGAEETGLVIATLAPDSDLAQKGVTPGDIILMAGGQQMRAPSDLESAVAAAKRDGRPLLLQIEGRGVRRFVAASTREG
jgi:serine protease Do